VPRRLDGRPADQKDGAALHLHPDEIACPTADADETAQHAHADLDPGVAVDEDLAAPHAHCAAAVSCADLPAGLAVDADEAAGHLCPQPVRSVPLDRDGPAAHGCSEVHSRVAVDGDAAQRHTSADPLDLREVSVQLKRRALLAFDLEEVPQAPLPIAQKRRQGQDLRVREGSHDAHCAVTSLMATTRASSVAGTGSSFAAS
jgi:hypothetical protein